MEQGRCDVIRDVGYDRIGRADRQGDMEGIAFDDRQSIVVGRTLTPHVRAKQHRHARVDLHRRDMRTMFQEYARENTHTRTDLEYGGTLLHCCRIRDRGEHVVIDEEMLSEVGIESDTMDTEKFANDLVYHTHSMHYRFIIVGFLIMIAGVAFVPERTLDAAAILPRCLSRVAERRNERLLRRGRPPLCTPRTVGSSSLSSSISSSVGSSASSVSRVASYDPLPYEAPRSRFVLLGETGPPIAAFSIFLNEEPFIVRSMRINLTSSVSGLERILVYAQDGRLLGAARFDPNVTTGRGYRLDIPVGTLTIERRQSSMFFLRPVLLSRDMGALPGQTLAVGNIVVEGDGGWSSQKYTKATVENFPSFVTARAVVDRVDNVLGNVASLLDGSDRVIAAYRFSGRVSDSFAHIDVTDLRFALGITGGVSITNPHLRADGLPVSLPCSLEADAITCANIPADFGSLAERPRTLTLSADMTVTTPNASVLASIDAAGDPSFAGSVSWWDGSVSYDWIDRSSMPQATLVRR